MTEVHIHGILGKKYGKIHKLAISRPKDLLFALEANNPDFFKDLSDLAKKNIHYTFVCDNKWLKCSEMSQSKKSKKIDFVPVILGAGPTLIIAIIALIIAIASAIYSYIQAGKIQYPKIPAVASSVSAFSKSILFTSRENITEQGNPVPLVYGRLKIGSYVIQTSLKSFPLSVDLKDEFVNTSTKKGTNLSAIITDMNYNPFGFNQQVARKLQ